MRLSPLVVLFLILASVLSGAQNPAAPNPAQKPGPQILTWTPPEHPIPPFGSQIRNAVVVIHLYCKDHDGKVWDVTGTGFIVSYHDPRLANDQSFQYLVTNRHVTNCPDENGGPGGLQSVSLQVNLKSDASVNLPLSQNGNISWVFPSDDSVDLALIPVNLPPQVNNASIPIDSFFAKEDFTANNIGEGAKIILSGYSYHFRGESRPLPLVREGILSMISDTPLETTMKKPGKVYLGNVHIFGGNSGSPVFISLAGIRPSGIVLDDNYRFLGVVSGFYNEDSDFNLEIATTVKGTQHANSGISMIVPADFLKDLILNNAGLKGFREAYVATLTPGKK